MLADPATPSSLSIYATPPVDFKDLTCRGLRGCIAEGPTLKLEAEAAKAREELSVAMEQMRDAASDEMNAAEAKLEAAKHNLSEIDQQIVNATWDMQAYLPDDLKEVRCAAKMHMAVTGPCDDMKIVVQINTFEEVLAGCRDPSDIDCLHSSDISPSCNAYEGMRLEALEHRVQEQLQSYPAIEPIGDVSLRDTSEDMQHTDLGLKEEQTFGEQPRGPVDIGQQLVNWYCYEMDIPPLSPRSEAECGTDMFGPGATLLYLADKKGSASTPEQRFKYTKWVMWANSTLKDVCFGLQMSGTQLHAPCRALDTLEESLHTSDWLVDGEFSVADVAVSGYLNYVPVVFGWQDWSGRPRIVAYMKRCASRPSFTRVFGYQHCLLVISTVLG